MRLDRRFLLVVGISMVWALLVSAMFYRLAGASGHGRPPALKPVVVATRLLPAGSVVDRASVGLRAMPENMFPPGGYSRIEDVLDRPVTSQIQSGEPVVELRLALKGSGIGLGPLIPPGMRAMAVRVNDVVGVAGFALPGMRVDVLATGKPPNRPDLETQTVLQDILVLAVGQTTATDGKSQPIVAPVVTLLVSPQQAEALTLADGEGRIQLVLRNSTDRTIIATDGRKLRELYRMAPVETPPAAQARPTPQPRVRPAASAAPPATAPEKHRVLVINGHVETVEVFSADRGVQ
jgi:pilus assembly protein CpaB